MRPARRRGAAARAPGRQHRPGRRRRCRSHGEVVLSLRRLGGLDAVDARRPGHRGAGATLAAVRPPPAPPGWPTASTWRPADSATVGGIGGHQRRGAALPPLRRHPGPDCRRRGGARRRAGGLAPRRAGEGQHRLRPAGLLCGSEGTLAVVTAARLRLVARARRHRVVALLAFATVAAAVAAAGRCAAPPCPTSRRPRAVPGRRGGARVPATSASAPPFGRLGTGLPRWSRWRRPARPDRGAGRRRRRLAVGGGRRGGRRDAGRPGPAVALPGGPHRGHQRRSARRTSSTSRCRPASWPVPRGGPERWSAPWPRRPHVAVRPRRRRQHPRQRHRASARDDLRGGRRRPHGSSPRLGGSISAEHGIGTAKRRWLDLNRSAAEIAAMRAIKAALDPDGISTPTCCSPDRAAGRDRVSGRCGPGGRGRRW